MNIPQTSTNPLNWHLNHALLALAWQRAYALNVIDSKLDSHVQRTLLRELVLLGQDDFEFLQYSKRHGVKVESLRQWLTSAPTPEYARLSKEQFGNLPSNATNRLELSNNWKNQIHQRTLGLPTRSCLVLCAVAFAIAVANPINAILPHSPVFRTVLLTAAAYLSTKLSGAIKGLLKGKHPQAELLPQLQFIDPNISPESPGATQIMAGLSLLKPRERLLLCHLDAVDLRSFLGGNEATKHQILHDNPPPTWNWLRFLNLAVTPCCQAITDLIQGRAITSDKIIQNFHNRRTISQEIGQFRLPTVAMK